MKVLVTGAGGFLGRAVVDAVSAAGHDVVALIRPASRDVAHFERPGITVLRGDLRQRGSWQNSLEVDAVVHLAAAIGGDLASQFVGTVLATENLIDALPISKLERFVHISSFSVYDLAGLPAGSILDETTPVEPHPDQRDAYTITKMWQEQLVIDRCADSEIPYVIIRPGAIYGPGKTWNFGRALVLGGNDVILASRSMMRLTHVENCASAIAKALTAEPAIGQVVNIVDDNLPTFGGYCALCRRSGARLGRRLSMPWWSVDAVGRTVKGVNALFFKGNAKLPEILALRRQHAQWKNLRYSNAKAKQLLGWSPTVSIEEGVERMIRDENRASDS